MNLRRSTEKKTAESTLKSPQRKPSSPNPPGRVFTEKQDIELLLAFESAFKKDPSLKFSAFPFAHFSQTQVAAKLKRLKGNYHKMAKTKSRINTPHLKRIYPISRRIWGSNSNAHSPKDPEVVKNNVPEQKVDLDLDLGKFPFLVESVSEEVKRVKHLYLEGMREMGEEKCKELNDKWMVLSIQNAEIQIEKSLLLQKQFVLFAEATQKV